MATSQQDDLASISAFKDALLYEPRYPIPRWRRAEWRFLEWLFASVRRSSPSIEWKSPLPFDDVTFAVTTVAREKIVPTHVMRDLDTFIRGLTRDATNKRNAMLPLDTRERAINLLHDIRTILQRDCDVLGDKAYAKFVPPTLRPRTLNNFQIDDGLVGDDVLATARLFDHLNSIRRFLKDLWAGYRDSKVSLTTAALVTNIAIQRIKYRIDCHAFTMHTYLPGYQVHDLPDYAWEQRAHLHHSDLRDNIHPAKWCCIEAHCDLKFAQIHIYKKMRFSCVDKKPRHANLTRLLWPSVEDPVLSPDSDLKESSDTLTKFQLKSLKFILHLCKALNGFPRNVSWLGKDGVPTYDIDINNPVLIPCHDKLTNGLLEWTRRLAPARLPRPLWVTVAFQSLLDIMITLGRYSSSAADDLKEEVATQNNVFHDNILHSAARLSAKTDGLNAPWPSNTWLGIQNCLMKWSLEQKQINKSGEYTLDDICENQPGLFLLEANPVLCGMQAYWLKRLSRSFRLWAVKLHESIVPAALLYMMARRLEKVDQWLDMELVIRIRGREMLKYLRASWEFDSWPGVTWDFKPFALLLPENNKSPGPPEPLLDVLDDIFSSYYEPHAFTDSIPLFHKDMSPKQLVSRTLDLIKSSDRVKETIKSLTDKSSRPGFENNRDINLLTLIKQACDEGDMHSSFDWFKMHDKCQSLFDRLRKESRQKYDTYMEQTSHTKRRSKPIDEHSSSMDALYYLAFTESSDQRIENMVLAILLLGPPITPTSGIPNREYIFERWNKQITHHKARLGICMESAAGAIQALIHEGAGDQICQPSN